MDTSNIKNEYFLKRQWGMNCQPGHRKGKNIRRRAKKEHIRQAKRQFKKDLEDFCLSLDDVSSDDKIDVSSDDKIDVSSDDKIFVKNENSDDILNKPINNSASNDKYKPMLDILSN